MGMLNQVLGQVMANARAKRSATEKEDPIKKENRDAWRKLYTTAETPQQRAALLGSAPEGIDKSIYSSTQGMQTPEQDFDTLLNKTLQDFLTGGQGGQGAPVPTQAPTQTPSPTPQGGISAPAPTQAPTPAPTQSKTSIFLKDYLLRAALKKYANTDIGAHYFEAPKWFEEFNTLTDSGVPFSEAMTDLAAKYGFIPDGASNLKDLSDIDRNVIFNKEISAALNDPTLNEVIKKVVPEGVDINKSKLGYVLDAFASQGRYIAPEYQPYLDRFRGLEDPNFVNDEIKTWVIQSSGIPLEMHSDIPGAIADAREKMSLDSIISTSRQAAARVTGATEAEWEMEKSKPIPGETRTKYGIGSKIKTLQDLADAGYRFPTDAERNEYRDLTDLTDIMENKLKPLIDKIFTSGSAYGSRVAHGAKIQKGMALGDDLGVTAQLYTRQLAIFSKKMLSMVERGGRFTDQDYQKMLESLPRVNFAMPDGKILASRLLEDARVMLGQKLDLYQDVLVKPIGQPGAEPPTEPTTTPTDQYQKGAIYPGANGTKAKYLGDGQWQMIK